MIPKTLITICLALLILPQFSEAQQNPPTTEALEQLGEAVDGYIKKDMAVGGELLVIQKDKVLYHKSFGLSDVEAKTPWENDIVCNIRSMSKPITSAAAQILIDRKQLDLDAPVAKYLESFDCDESRAITVRQVLTHRSGLPLTNIARLHQYTSLQEQVEAGGDSGPQFEPGSKFWYSDLGSDVVGRLVEKASGKLLHEFVKAELLDPLGMTSSFYGIAGTKDRLSNAANLYLKNKTGWFPFWKSGSEPMYDFAWGSQTIYSTTSDYGRFINMLLNQGRIGDKQILSEAAVARMIEPVSRAKAMGTDANAPCAFSNLETWYGQLLVTYHRYGTEKTTPVAIGHSGSDGTIAWGWPENDLIILYFTQSRGGLSAIRIEEAIDRLILNPGGQSNESVPEKYKPYLGTFIANYKKFDNEEFTVKFDKGTLVLDIPSQLPFELLPPDEDGKWAFAMVPKKVQVSFNRNENNEVESITLHQSKNEFDVPRKGSAAAQQQAKARKQKSPSPSTENTTVWAGTLDTGSAALRLEINIISDGDKLSGFVRSLDQNNVEIQMKDVTSDEETLSFTIPKANAKFAGTVSKEGNISEGTFTQNGRDIPFKLTKTPAAKKISEQPNAEVLKHAWVGKLDLGPLKPVMQFRIMELESGKTSAYFDSVTEGRTGFNATWKIEGDQLKFDVPNIKLTYRGTLNKSGDKAEGIWSQGGRDVPLALTKQGKAFEE